jgi:hypothetical protein
MIVTEKKDAESKMNTKAYKEDQVNEFYSMCRMKNKHSKDDEDKSNDYRYFERLYDGLSAFTEYLHKFTEKGIIPNQKFIKDLEFGSKIKKEEKDNTENETLENIEDVESRIKNAAKEILKYDQQKAEYLKEPLKWSNFFVLQMMGKSLIKMNNNNFRHYVKYFESQIDIQSGDNIDRITKDKSTNALLELLEKFFADFKNIIQEKITANMIKKRQSQKHIKYVELPIESSYNFILNKFRTTLGEKYTADQILFCSWHTKWPQVESKQYTNIRLFGFNIGGCFIN